MCVGDGDVLLFKFCWSEVIWWNRKTAEMSSVVQSSHSIGNCLEVTICRCFVLYVRMCAIHEHLWNMHVPWVCLDINTSTVSRCITVWLVLDSFWGPLNPWDLWCQILAPAIGCHMDDRPPKKSSQWVDHKPRTLLMIFQGPIAQSRVGRHEKKQTKNTSLPPFCWIIWLSTWNATRKREKSHRIALKETWTKAMPLVGLLISKALNDDEKQNETNAVWWCFPCLAPSANA